MSAGTRLASRYSAGDGKLARCSAGAAHPSGHLKPPSGTVPVEVTDASSSPVAESRAYSAADPDGYTAAERGSLLHGRVYGQDATTSGFGNVRFARVAVGRIRVGLYDTGGKPHAIEASVADGQRLRLAIRLP